MGKEEYRSCMSKKMREGRLKGISKEERKIEFCVIAKQCSKGMPEAEARLVCSQPKPPKPPKLKGSKVKKVESCETETLNLAQCMMNYFENNKIYNQVLNINSVGIAITNALMECECGK